MVIHIAVVRPQVDAAIVQREDQCGGQGVAVLGSEGQVVPLLGAGGDFILVHVKQTGTQCQVLQGQRLDLQIKSLGFHFGLVRYNAADARWQLMLELVILDLGGEQCSVHAQAGIQESGFHPDLIANGFLVIKLPLRGGAVDGVKAAGLGTRRHTGVEHGVVLNVIAGFDQPVYVLSASSEGVVNRGGDRGEEGEVGRGD